MIDLHLKTSTNNINNTLLIFFNDNIKPSLSDIQYDCLELYNPKPNPWFFYHIEDYIKGIEKYISLYKNILLFGGSKGASAAIVLSNLIKHRKIFNNVLCWAMSPALRIQHGESIQSNHRFVSLAWDRIKDNQDIKHTVDKYGQIFKYIDCTFPILYSYSFNNDWTFDKDAFESIRDKLCIIEDYVEPTEKLLTFTNKPPHQNLHNILGYYWKIERDLFYTKLEKFITEYT